MSTYLDIGYNSLLLKDSTLKNYKTITEANSDAILGDSAVSYDKLTINKLNVKQNMESENFVHGVSGWKIYGSGAAEFQTVIAGSYIKTYAQDTEPSGGTYNSGDLWIDTNDGNKLYRYSGSAWVSVSDENALWSSITGTGKPDDNATVGAIIGTNVVDSDSNVLGDDDVKNIERLVCGEDIGAGNVVCIKNIPKDDFDTIVKDAYVSANAPTTNYGTNDTLYAGSVDSDTAYSFIQIPTPASPLVEQIMKVELLLYINNWSVAAANLPVVLKSADASWDESTITWNTMPSVTDNLATYFTTKTKTLISDDSGTYVSFDITQIYKYWLDGALTNNGLRIEATYSGSDRVGFSSSDSATNKPILRITSYDQSDGLAYRADANDYNLCRTIVGITPETKTTGNIIKVQKFGKMDLDTTTYGKRLYLSTQGGYNLYNTDSSIERRILLGKVIGGGDNETEIAIQNNNVFIESIGGITATSNTRYYAQGDTNMAIISLLATGASYLDQDCQVTLYKNGLSSHTIHTGIGDTVTVSWDSDRNYIRFSFGGSGGATVYSVKFFN